MKPLHYSSVSFTYDGLAQPLIDDFSLTIGTGWTGIVGSNGAGKSTLLHLATGLLQPQLGSLSGPSTALYCAQRTDAPPEGLDDLLAFPDAEAGRLASMLGLEGDWPFRWATLSHGERKRAQIAVALWNDPELLAIDEPTNHLDASARDALRLALERYTGIGLIVSHDRRLLDALCSQCVFLERGGAFVVRPGGVSQGLLERDRERIEQRRAYDQARAERDRIEREATRRREEAGRQDRRRSKRNLRWKDSDARAKIDLARVTGADGHAGRLLNQLDGRRAQASERLDAMTAPIRERRGITVHGRRSQSDVVVYRAEGTLELPDGRRVRHPELIVRPEDRIALVGPNGCGKTTLVGQLLAGNAKDVLWIPQEIPAQEAGRLAERVRSLEHDALGRVISTVSRLGSEPERVLATELPSPGETRKLMLALGLEATPALVAMDEPTNHLDLTSVLALQCALEEFAGALLLVSHDEEFIEALATVRWVFRDGYLDVIG